MVNFQELTELRNHNFKMIRTQISLQKNQELYSEYNPEDDSHLAKILAIKKVRL